MMKRFHVVLLSGLLLDSAVGVAQEPTAPSSPKPAVSPPNGPPPRPGDRRGMMPGFGRPPMRSEAFEKLPETDKKRVRDALDKVWGRPEVIAARDRAMDANEALRDTIRQSLEKSDPEAAAILAKIEPKNPFDPRQLPPMPSPEAADFPNAVVTRLGMEMLAFAKPDRREETKRFHERLLASENVRAALREVEMQRGEARIEAAQKLRQVYRESAMKEFQALRERRAKEEAPGSPAPR